MENLSLKALFFVCFLASITFAQTKINGLVLNEDLEPIQNANIYIENYAIGSVSDADGYFSILLSDSLLEKDLYLLLSHIAFDSIKVPLAAAINKKKFILPSKTFKSSQILVEGQNEPFINKELPVSITVIDAREIENKGFVDVGDFIRTDQSVQIDEQLTGKKTLSMRAGNADDVLILYNGIALNSNYNNSYDLSLLNVEEIKQIEIIKGSNTSLYGAEAFSGVINIIPKVQQKHNVRFMQKFGSYNSGTWNLNLNFNWIDNLYLTYSQRRSGSQRKYDSGSGELENLSQNHTANLIYYLPGENSVKNTFNAMYMYNENDYSNSRLFEVINDVNDLASFSYSGSIGPLKEFELITSYNRFNTSQKLLSDSLFTGRKIDNEKFSFIGRKNFNFNMIDFLISYQYDDIKLNYDDRREFFDNSNETSDLLQFKRNKNGLVGLVAFDLKKDELADEFKLAISYRYDMIDDGNNEFLASKKVWHDDGFKTSVKVVKKLKTTNLIINASAGTNTKYPSLFNLISTPADINEIPGGSPNLAPEKNRSQEVGLTIEKENLENKKINRLEVSFSYFQNFYENKFRSFYSPYSAVAIFDNVKTAEIEGYEINLQLLALNRSWKFDAGFSSYSISDMAAFPLKSDFKLTAALGYQKYGYNIDVNFFQSGDKVVWLRDFSNNLVESIVPASTNANLYFTKEVELYSVNFGLNLSIMNLLDDKTKLNGLTINDRRIYFGFEVKY